MNRSICIRITQLLVLILLAGSLLAYPSDRRNPMMSWSDEADGVILFGGLSPADVADIRYAYADTWKWDGSSWVRLTPARSPSGRYGAAMVYDEVNDRILMFGGTNGTAHFNDTWAFADGNWTRLAQGGPEPRRFAAGAFDPVTARFVLFGGFVVSDPDDETQSTVYHDTWEFDGTSWTEIEADGPEIAPSAMAYDEARGELIMIGRDDANERVTLRYDGTTWVELAPENQPQCVGQSGLVFHDVRQTLITYGGACAGGLGSRTHEWDGSDWNEIEGARQIGSRLGYGFAYDENRDEVVLYGGVTTSLTGDSGERGTTWVFRRGEWVRVDAHNNPGPRTMFVFSRNIEDDGVLLFGGQSFSTFFDDLWNRDSQIWQLVRREPEPGLCTTPVGGVDPNRDRFP